MNIEFSQHAELKIKQRKLPWPKILATLAHPDFRQSSYNLREELFKKFGKNYLKVVVVYELNTVVIVTAHWVAQIPKK